MDLDLKDKNKIEVNYFSDTGDEMDQIQNQIEIKNKEEEEEEGVFN